VSAQFIEILFLAGIAFLIISKFISMLGTTDDDDPARNLGSNFGEPGSMKNVTGTMPHEADERVIKILRLGKKLKGLDEETNRILAAVFDKLPNFDPKIFLTNAKTAFSMIIQALDEQDLDTLEDLVDKRFLDQIKKMESKYGAIKSDKLKASCVDSYSFGNSIYVKALFEGSNITENIKSFKEEWVFTKNITQRTPEWYLSNIEVVA
jgi:predicted lipid-binding transport protein (Tim44 family)